MPYGGDDGDARSSGCAYVRDTLGSYAASGKDGTGDGLADGGKRLETATWLVRVGGSFEDIAEEEVARAASSSGGGALKMMDGNTEQSSGTQEAAGTFDVAMAIAEVETGGKGAG